MPFIEMAGQRRSPTPPPGMQPPENAKDWFRIDNSAEDSDETDIYVYDSIGGWFGMYADEFIEALGAVKTAKINLRLNSPGGSVFEGIAIANAIRSHPANVTVYVDSVAASIASVIALAGNRVVMMPQSQFMVHNASGGCYGDATAMTQMADLLDKQSLNIAQAYAEHTGRPVSEWQDYMAAETWFTAEEAVAAGLADEAMPMRPKKGEDAEEPASVAALMNRAWDLSMYQHAGRDAAPAPVINQAPAEPATTPIEPTQGEIVVPVQVSNGDADTHLLELIRNVIRAELEDAAKKKLPAFLQPDEDEEEEGDEESDTEDASEEDPEAHEERSPAAVVGEEPHTLPAGPGNPPSEHPTDTGLDHADDNVERTETYDENDEWLSLVDRLTDPPPSSADDVFSTLKEGW